MKSDNIKRIRALRTSHQESRKERQEFGKGKFEYIFCPEGDEVYYHKSWHHVLEDAKYWRQDKNLAFKLCPFHQMVKNGQYEGEVVIQNVPEKYKNELIKLIENRGKTAYRIDVLDRVIKIEDNGSEVRVETSENQLAQKISNAISSRFKNVKEERTRGGSESDVVRIKIMF